MLTSIPVVNEDKVCHEVHRMHVQVGRKRVSTQSLAMTAFAKGITE